MSSWTHPVSLEPLADVPRLRGAKGTDGAARISHADYVYTGKLVNWLHLGAIWPNRRAIGRFINALLKGLDEGRRGYHNMWPLSSTWRDDRVLGR